MRLDACVAVRREIRIGESGKAFLQDRRWQVAEELEVYHANEEKYAKGWPVHTDSEI
jgi:hypothetical protein